jgi:hypothetical protein
MTVGAIGIQNALSMLSNLINSSDANEVFTDLQLDVLDALLQKLTNMLEDGIQKHEIMDLRMLLKDILSASEFDAEFKKLIDSMLKVLDKLEKRFEEKNDYETVDASIKVQAISGKDMSVDAYSENDEKIAAIAETLLDSQQNPLLASDALSLDEAINVGAISGAMGASSDKKHLLGDKFLALKKDEQEFLLTGYELGVSFVLNHLESSLEKLLSGKAVDSKKINAIDAMLAKLSDNDAKAQGVGRG